MTMSGSTVLIVDDERTLARAVKAFLAEAGSRATEKRRWSCSRACGPMSCSQTCVSRE
jgi:CheY-like chemotaxis protein